MAAQSLRKAAAAAPTACFEELLAEVESSGDRRTPNGNSAKVSRWQPPQCKLLRRPPVFTLAIVWDSPQAPIESIRGTVEALGSEVDLAGVFGTSAEAPLTVVGPPHRLRSGVCYFGHHYLVFVLCEGPGGGAPVWLSFDDEEVQVVGGWPDVCRTMVSRRLQPSLLFYEDRSCS